MKGSPVQVRASALLTVVLHEPLPGRQDRPSLVLCPLLSSLQRDPRGSRLALQRRPPSSPQPVLATAGTGSRRSPRMRAKPVTAAGKLARWLTLRGLPPRKEARQGRGLRPRSVGTVATLRRRDHRRLALQLALRWRRLL